MTVAIDADAVRWSEPPESVAGRPLMVLLHGLGSNEGDLFGLAPMLPSGAVIASVRAPLAWGPGWAWFPTQAAAPDADAVAAATDALLEWLGGMAAPASVQLLGFSQGGAMALELLRRAPEAFDRVVVLAGFVALPASDADHALAARRPAVFWGRGDADTVIAPARIATTGAWLDAHTAVESHVYAELPHSISAEEMADVLAFLTRS